ncbi:hypothetical protein ACPPVW_18700 [Leifsonia sp. McL0607]|uniref:hypothetical protein n=1 Tax=Leifsonia sp. McL0607 TaxID=3415672 RepID=UPI003CF111D0
MEIQNRSGKTLPGQPGAPATRSMRSRTVKRLGAGLTALGLILGVGALAEGLSAPAANAVDVGHGYGSIANGTHKGTYPMPNGDESICIVPGAPSPTGGSSDQGVTGDVRGLSDVQKAQIHMITATMKKNMANPPAFNGQATNANMWAAAAGFAGQYVADPAGMIADNGNPGSTFDSQINWAKNTIVAESSVAEFDLVKAIANHLRSEAQNITPATAFDPIVENNMDPSHNFEGTVTLSGVPVGSKSDWSFFNSKVKETGEATASTVDSVTLNTLGVPPTNDPSYKAGGSVTVTAIDQWIPQLRYYVGANGQQDTVSATDVPNTQTATIPFGDPFPRNVPPVTSKAQELASPGSEASETVTVTGLPAYFPRGGIDVTSTAYLMPGEKPTPGQDVSTGTTVFTSPVWNTAEAGDHTWTIPTLDESVTAGKHLMWVHTWTNHDTGDVLGISRSDDENEATPIRDVEVVTTPQVHESAWAQDEIDVDGWVKKGDYIVVTQYAVPLGEPLVCTPENQVGTPLNSIQLTPGNNKHAKYRTQKTGTLVAGVQYGFVERYFRDGKPYKEGGCLDELFTVDEIPPTTPEETPETPENPEAPKTPETPAPMPELPIISG